MRRILLIALALMLAALPASALAHPKGIVIDDNYTGIPDRDFYRDLQWVQRAHLNILHLYIRPSALRSQRDVRYFTNYLRTVRRNGIRVLLTVWQNSTAYMIAHPQQFAQECAHVAELWRPYLAAIELGNEPNDNTAADIGYVRMLQAAYPAIKQVAPNMTVVAGALGYANGSDLETMYSAGLHGYFDAFSAHPYTDNGPPRSMGPAGYCLYNFACGLPWLHQVMAANGDGDKRLWLTEMGWATKDYGPATISEQKRAVYMRQVGQMTRSWPWIGAVIFYQLRYGDPPQYIGKNERDLEIGLALINIAWQPTPGFWALADTRY